MSLARPGSFVAACFLALCSAAAVAACSASNDGSAFPGKGGSGGSGGSGGEAGSGGSAAGGIIGGDDSGTGGDDGGLDDGCASLTQGASLAPLDMYIMMDQSGSMSDYIGGGGSKWNAVVNAVSTYVATAKDPQGIGIGIQYFGLNGDTCNSAPYSVPEVPIAPLTAMVTFNGQTVTQAQAITMSMGYHGPSTGTPTMPAVQGMINYAKAIQIQNPTHKVIAVLATDGDPSGCDENIQNIASVLAAGLTGNPPIQSFVIGVGSSFSNLQGIAAGGGANNFFQVDQGAQQFVQAMEQIRGQALGCEYNTPTAPAGQVLNFDQVQVQFTPSNGGQPSLLDRSVSGAAGCGASGGWYYDDNQDPKKIILCPSTCTTVQADDKGKVEIVLQCGGQH